VLGLILGKRVEKHIDRRPLAPGSSGAAKLEPSTADRQDGAGRQHIDVFRLDPFAVPSLENRHPRSTAQDLGKHALAVPRQVRDNDERQPVVGRNRPEELLRASTPPAEAPMPTIGRLDAKFLTCRPFILSLTAI
jgi:hypothetical protein